MNLPTTIECKVCGTGIVDPRCHQQYCSHECRDKQRRIRPDREVLVEQYSKMTQAQIAREYSVSRVAVHKWLKHYNLLPSK